MKVKLIAANVVALILVFVIMGLTFQAPSQAEDSPASRVVTVEEGSVASAVNATGTLEPRDETDVSFELDGVIKDVLAELGQRVEKGDPLAELDTYDLELELQQAKIDVKRKEAALSELKSGASAEDLASAQAAVVKAQAAYDELAKGPSEDEITVAAGDLRTAEVAVQQAQGDYDRVSWKGGVGASAEAQALEEATIAYEKALANYNIENGAATDEELKAAQADIASAKASLAELLRGSTAEDIAVAEADLEEAQLTVQTVERSLSQAVLKAPMAGTVVEMVADPGQRALEDTIILTLADLAQMQVSVPVDEIDLPLVQVGQVVTVTLDALSNESFGGHVTFLAPSPTESDDGTTSYEVTITLDRQDDRIRTGMTSKIAIETQRLDGVPLILSSVIQTDDSGQTYVEQVGADGNAMRVPVTLGLRNGQMVQVVEGLQVGDQVLVPASTTKASTTATTQRQGGMIIGGPMMGGGPPPGGFQGASRSGSSSRSGNR